MAVSPRHRHRIDLAQERGHGGVIDPGFKESLAEIDEGLDVVARPLVRVERFCEPQARNFSKTSATEMQSGLVWGGASAPGPTARWAWKRSRMGCGTFHRPLRRGVGKLCG